MNIFSIALGLASLLLAVHALRRGGCLICCTVGFGTCGAALLCQLWELYRLTCIGDTAAVYDTVYARVLAAMALLAGNLLLHTAALIRGRKRKVCG